MSRADLIELPRPRASAAAAGVPSREQREAVQVEPLDPADGPERLELPAHVRAALVDDVCRVAASVLSEDEQALVTVTLVEADDGPTLRVRGRDDLVDRIEAALYPPDGGDEPTGPAPTAAAETGRGPGEGGPDQTPAGTGTAPATAGSGSASPVRSDRPSG